MKQITPYLAAALLAAAPLQAGDHDAPKSPFPTDDEMEQLGDIAQSWMKRFADRMAPMVEQLKDMVDDLDAYEAPEMLENGDIIIRRKRETPEQADEPPSIQL